MSHQLNLISLKNKNGLSMSVTNFGGRIVSLLVPDRNGKLEDVVLGYDKLDDYLKPNPYFGSLIGRYANRIGGAKFTLEGKTYQLPVNNGPNSLHGGPTGYHDVYWQLEKISSKTGEAVRLKYFSNDGEDGYPGNLTINVIYTLSDDNELIIEFDAVTDKTTVINLTDHSYFNLAGAGSGTILDHVMMINATHFTPVDEHAVPTGELRPVKGTPFDFTQPHTIGSKINDNDEQLNIGKGYDHNFVLNKRANEFSHALRVSEPVSGRTMDVWTTDVGVQFYSGNFLDGSHIGKDGKPYWHRSAFCTETQHFPDSPNKSQFPSTVLRPGEVYSKKTVYKFSV